MGLGIQRFIGLGAVRFSGKTVALQISWYDLSFIRNAFAKNKHVLTIFFDLEKAYDTTWKHGILSDLYGLDFRGHLPTFIGGFLSHRLFQVRSGSTLSDKYEQEMDVPQGSILSPILLSLKINNIVKFVLKGLEASLSVDDFALRIRAKFLPHAQRLMQLCVNNVQDRVSKNGFKFPTSKTVCIHFCNQRKHFAEPSILLDKTPIKTVTEAKFLGVAFDRTLSYSSHVKYLKTNCLKALDILNVVGHTFWEADPKKLYYVSITPCKIPIRLWGHCIWGSFKQLSKETGPHPSPRVTNCSWSFPYFPSNKPLYESKRSVKKKKKRRKKISVNYVLKLKTCPDNPAYSCVFEPPNLKLFEKSNLTLPLGLRILPV